VFLEIHDTPVSAGAGPKPVALLFGLAGLSNLERLPLKRSASMIVSEYGQLSLSQSIVLVEDPTAMQSVAVVHDTELRTLAVL
jgi:hypothetical protein